MEAQGMTSMDIQKMLKDYIMGNSNFDTPQELHPDDNLLQGGVLDSLGIAEITEYMEKNFVIEIGDDEIFADNYRSINTLTAFCQSKQGTKVDG
jgi:acyl carrier protein